jgi:hypothetical protein
LTYLIVFISKDTKEKLKMKKSVILSSLLLGGAVLGLASCNSSNINQSKELGKEQSFNVGTVTGLNALNSATNVGRSLKAKNTSIDIGANDDVNTIKGTILFKVDLLLENNLNFESKIFVLEVGSEIVINKTSYSNVDKISYTANDETTTVSLIYNFDSIENETKEEKNEYEANISGYAYYGDYDITLTNPDLSLINLFKFESESEIESEGEETENEREFRFFASETNYIEIEQSSEISAKGTETSFEYSNYVNEIRTSNLEFSIDNSETENEIEVEINGIEYSLSIMNIDEEKVYKVEVSIGDDDKEMTFMFKKDQDGKYVEVEVTL